MSLIDFESSREKEKKRQWEREARNAILEKAKNKYESEKLQEEARRQRGEHTWMLPSVESKLQSDKKEKKKKKDKKKKKSKKKRNSSSSSSSENDEEPEAWVEKPGPTITKAAPAGPSTQDSPTISQEVAKRDGWMEMTSLFKTYSRDQIKERDGTSRKKEKEEERRRKQEADKPGSHARELNPYYKDGGSGLPQEENVSKSSTPQSGSIGLDAAWLRKALQRAKEQAQLENTSLEEIAARRWGSLDKFHELLAQAEGKGRVSVQYTSKWNRNQTTWKEEKRSRERRSRSSDKQRSRRRSKSIERKKHGYKESRRHSRSKSRERSYKNDDKKGGDKDKRNQGKHRQRSRSSSSDSFSSRSSSNSSRSSDHHDSKIKRDQLRMHQPNKKSSQRPSVGMMKPPDSEMSDQKSTLLSSKFHRPGENINRGSHSAGFASRGPSSSSRGWQKKDYGREEQVKIAKKPEIESSSSSSSSEPESDRSDKEELVPKEELEKVSGITPETSSEKPAFLTDKEMNELAAKIMKAELLGNNNLANKLKNKLEAARTVRANAPSGSESGMEVQGGSKEEMVILTRTDARGFSRPVNITEPGESRKKKEKSKTHGKDGKRNKYFPDDDKYSLKQMFEAEKGTTADDQNSMFNRTAMQNHERLTEDYDMDDMFMSKAALKEDSAKQAERDRKRAIEEHKRSERSLESCHWCFDSKEMAKHLIVALGSKAYVCLPPHESLTPGHCLIVPVNHVMSSVHADEDLWSEIMNFRKSLVKMFISREEDCIFFETVKRIRNFPHMTLNCVPLPKEMGDMAPIYFKKAIMECEAEWAQNKKLVDLKNRDVRRAVPKGLPYFFVDFAMDSGFAHVIEDEQIFPTYFAQEIVGGMLDLDTNLWRKPRKENFDTQRRKVMEFSRWYKEFDITQEENE